MNIKNYIGIDIVEISRVKKSIENTGEIFLEKVFTSKEIEYCESKGKQKYQHYAGRFCAKEAVFKAVSKFLESKYDIDWKDIEVLSDESGRPYVVLHNEILNKKIQSIDVSISHCRDYAVANCVVTINL